MIINNLHLNIAESCNFICIVLHKHYIFALENYKTKAQQVGSSIRSIECSMQKAKFIDKQTNKQTLNFNIMKRQTNTAGQKPSLLLKALAVLISTKGVFFLTGAIYTTITNLF